MLENALEAADVCFISWRKKSLPERLRIIANAAVILRSRQEEFVLALIPEYENASDKACLEVALCADVLDYYATQIENLNFKESPAVRPTLREDEVIPFGIVFGFQPLAFPYFQLVRLVAPTLMAGNVVVIQHVDGIPPSALAFEKLWVDAGAPVGFYTNLRVSREQMARLHEDPRIHSISNSVKEAVKRLIEVPKIRPKPVSIQYAS